MADDVALAFPIRCDEPLMIALARDYEASQFGSWKVQRAESIRLKKDTSVADAFVAIGVSCLRHWLLNEQGVRLGNAEAVHQVRVALRRMRTGMSLFEGMLRDSHSALLKVELKWLTDQLGPARDYDVFLRQLQASSGAANAAEIDWVMGRRARALESAALAIPSERARKLFVQTARFLSLGDWRTHCGPHWPCRMRPVRALARETLERRTRKIRGRLKNLDRFDVRKRHRLRIAIRKLGYATEFFASLFTKSVRERNKFNGILKKLQGALGELNDIAVQERLAGDLAATSDGSGPSPFALAPAGQRLRSRHEARATRLFRAAVKQGKRLRKQARFWK